ncbi:hypothetical protein BTVI_39585 [Pitangus sulphuratus]|nr:hypothetical protein BTVI_39585 [Pitangus sulphuratus]
MSSCPAADCQGEEPNPHVATITFQVVVESDKVTPEPPLLHAKHPQLILTGLIPFTSCYPSLDTLQQLSVLSEWREPELDTVLEVWLH